MPALVAVDPVLDVADETDPVEDLTAVAVAVEEAGLTTAAGDVSVIVALTAAAAFLVQKPCSGVTSG